MRKPDDIPPLSAFTPAELRLIRRLNTPAKVQRYLNGLPYNTEKHPLRDSLRGFREVIRRKTAHCLEAALFAACVLERYGHPPLVMSLMSADMLDHVIYVYRGTNGRWGAIGRSRDPGLHGRKAAFRSPRALALSYFDPYVDHTGSLTGYAVADLRDVEGCDWRFSRRNVWPVEKYLLRIRHRKLPRRRARVKRLRRWYRDYRKRNGDRKPLAYRGREKWLPLPKEFL
ncbi:MAG: hypothetical protein FJX62_06315 [Alphaproteobacteria bacterium]|nr:hypothetical protein [Alphaproteobacteria bacterium]